MNKWEMLDKVITKFGFEVEETIEFAYLCENGTDQQIKETFENLMKQGLTKFNPYDIINITKEKVMKLVLRTRPNKVKIHCDMVNQGKPY